MPPNAAPSALRFVPSLVERFSHTPDASKLVFVMVGLPARGKSFIAMRLTRFLQWTGTETRIFNAGNHRRKTETGVQDASYFDPTSPIAAARREQIAQEVITDMLDWLDADTERFAVFDATNTTRARRRRVAEKIRSRPGVGVIFVESICNDDAVKEANLAQKLSKSPDYAKISQTDARQDLLQRIDHYEKVYEPLEEEEMLVDGERLKISYIKLLNLCSHVVAHNIWGRAATTVLPYLMALHVGSRPLWLVRLPRAGGWTPHAWRSSGRTWPPPKEVQFSDVRLSSDGEQFADAVAAFAKLEASSVAVFTCVHRRGLQLAERLNGGRARTALNPQDRGMCDGLSYNEIKSHAPEVAADPLHKRFPGGESLSDMLQRLQPTLIEMEQEMRPVLAVAPLSALQVLYCHYAALPVSTALTVDIPAHTVVEIRPNGGNFVERRLGLTQLLEAQRASSTPAPPQPPAEEPVATKRRRMTCPDSDAASVTNAVTAAHATCIV